MREDANRDYHVERARIELDAAYRAAGPAAARAHFHLSSLHMARARLLLQAASEPSPEVEWIDRCRALHELALA